MVSGERFACHLMSSHQDQQDHLVDRPLTQDIAGLLRDVHRALEVYADPMTSHALQIYHSVLATVPHGKLLDYTRRQDATPRLVSQRTSDWSSVMTVIEGHTGGVRSVAYSPDGARIVSGSEDRTIRVWDAHTGKQLAVLEGHKYRVMSVAFSPDGKRITSKDLYGDGLVWNVPSALPLP
jgi:WD40 repeat protein